MQAEEWLRKWIRYFKLYYEEGEVQKKVEVAKDIIREHIDDSIFAISGGKDSMTLLHIAVSVEPELRVHHWDYGSWFIPREIESEILENIRKVAPRCHLHVKSHPRGERESVRHEWPDFYRIYFQKLKEYNAKHHILGIRAEESRRRAVRGVVVVREHWIEVYPIFNFTWRDVWAYIFTHNVPVPHTYFSYAKLLGWERVRFATFHDKEFEKYGSLAIDGVLMWRSKHSKRLYPKASDRV